MRTLYLQFYLLNLAILFQSLPTLADEAFSISEGRQIGQLEVFQECDDCPEMVVLPLGSFTFGSSVNKADEARHRFHTSRNVDPDTGDGGYQNPFLNETPAQIVTMDLPIAMARDEITREQWGACVTDNHCTDKFDARIRFRLRDGPYQEHPRSPITGITYTEMQDYVAWLNHKAGAASYRLPTEVEWEYAALAGSSETFAQGDTLTGEQANFAISWREFRDGSYEWHYDPANEKRPLSVDQLDAANSWGLRHMSGNVIEVTRSCYSERHLGFETSSRFLAATFQPLGCERVDKGGFYLGHVELSRPKRRTGASEDHWSPWVGFRVVRDMYLVSDRTK